MEELAKNDYFIVITGISSILGFIISVISLFLISKVININKKLNIKIDKSLKINEELNLKVNKSKKAKSVKQKVGSNSSFNKQTGVR